MPKPDQRVRELGRIHILAKQLGLTRDQYEAVLLTHARVESAALLDAHGRSVVIKHMEAVLARSGKQPKRRQRPALGKAELVSKVRALLMSAKPARDDAYADAMAKRMFHVDQFTWCDGDQLWRLIAALSYDRKRRSA